MHAPDRSCLAFTDGSCSKRTGPCDTGAFVYISDDERKTHGCKRLYSSGELVTIFMVPEIVVWEKI